MNKKRVLFGALAAIVLVGCGRRDRMVSSVEELLPALETAEVRVMGPLQGEPAMMDYVAALDGFIIVGSKRTDPVLNVYDVHSLQPIESRFKRGRGPNEVMYLGNFCVDSQALFVYDANANKQLWLPAGQILTGVPQTMRMPGGDKASRYMTLVPVWNNRYVAMGRLNHGDAQFCVLDSLCQITGYPDTYPQNEENKDFPSYDKAYGFQGQIVKTYDGKRFLYASRAGLVLKFFDATTDSVVKIREYLVQIPRFTPQSNPATQSYSIAGDANNLRGTESMTADDRYYYLLFSGRRQREDLSHGPVDQLLVFTHAGEPVARVRLDRPVDRIAFDTSVGKLYALIAEDASNQLAEILLPELDETY